MIGSILIGAALLSAAVIACSMIIGGRQTPPLGWSMGRWMAVLVILAIAGVLLMRMGV